MARKKTTETSSSNDFFREDWRGNRMEWKKVPEVRIRKALLEEIVPNKRYWKRSYTRPNEYYECVFNPIVNYSTIQELEPRIYVEI